ncbi:MAG: hypothetical protein QXU75_09045, partial [Candidatus Methanomethylicaceae archaeon]
LSLKYIRRIDYDHTQQRSVKGTNLVTHSISLPVGFELAWKTKRYLDPRVGKEKLCSERTTNEIYHDLLRQAVKNRIPFQYGPMTSGLLLLNT